MTTHLKLIKENILLFLHTGGMIYHRTGCASSMVEMQAEFDSTIWPTPSWNSGLGKGSEYNFIKASLGFLWSFSGAAHVSPCNTSASPLSEFLLSQGGGSSAFRSDPFLSPAFMANNTRSYPSWYDDKLAMSPERLRYFTSRHIFTVKVYSILLVLAQKSKVIKLSVILEEVEV